MEKIIAKASLATTEQVKEMLKTLASDLSKEATIVTSALLDVLANRVDEEEFCNFCEELEAA